MKRMIYESIPQHTSPSTHACTHDHTQSCSHLEEHVQRDDPLPQGLTEVVDGVINGILLGVQVEDPVRRAEVRWWAQGAVGWAELLPMYYLNRQHLALLLSDIANSYQIQPW